MKRAKVFSDGVFAGYLIEWEKGKKYEFSYVDGYAGDPISLTISRRQKSHFFDQFPPFFDGFLPEGFMLEAMLRKTKIDRNDRFEQLVRVGQELVGNITVEDE